MEGKRKSERLVQERPEPTKIDKNDETVEEVGEVRPGPSISRWHCFFRVLLHTSSLSLIGSTLNSMPNTAYGHMSFDCYAEDRR